MADLPARTRDLIRETRIEGLSTREAAQKHDMSESAVKVAVHRGLKALGGRDNVEEAGAASSRLWLKLRDPTRLDAGALTALGTKAIATPGAGVVHLIVGPEAGPIAASLLQ